MVPIFAGKNFIMSREEKATQMLAIVEQFRSSEKTQEQFANENIGWIYVGEIHIFFQNVAFSGF